MRLGIECEQRARLTDVTHALGHVEFDAVQRERVGRTPVQVPATVVVPEERRVPRTGRNLRRLRIAVAPSGQADIAAGRDRIRQFRQHARQEIEPPPGGIARHQHGPWREQRTHHQHAVAIGDHRRRDHAVERPAIGGDESPVDQIGRAPVAIGQGLEQIVGVAVAHDHRVGARAIGDPQAFLLEVVAVIDIQRIGVGLPCVVPRRRRTRHCQRGQQRHAHTSLPVHATPAGNDSNGVFTRIPQAESRAAAEEDEAEAGPAVPGLSRRPCRPSAGRADCPSRSASPVSPTSRTRRCPASRRSCWRR